MSYHIAKSLLMCMPPELAHCVSLKLLNLLSSFNLLKKTTCDTGLSKSVLGLSFANPVGLAAGLDKNAEYVNALFKLGFGFVEVGTITPKPQQGNIKPRLFRLPQTASIVNQMGFNNVGVTAAVENLKKVEKEGVLGINIGKNKSTPNKNAIDDYLLCMQHLYTYADYLVVNISSPNTPGLRQLQKIEFLLDLLMNLKQAQLKLADEHAKYVPLLVKISPDLFLDDLKNLTDVLIDQKIDGVIACNTTSNRYLVQGTQLTAKEGGLSGTLLRFQASKVLNDLKLILPESFPIISVGGITSPDEAFNRLKQGASLIQLYSGLIYEGPGLLKKILKKNIPAYV